MAAHVRGRGVKFGGADSPEGRLSAQEATSMRYGLINRARSNYLTLRSKWDRRDGSMLFWLESTAGEPVVEKSAVDGKQVSLDPEHPLFRGAGTPSERGDEHPLYIPPGSTIPKELADMLNRGGNDPTNP